MPPTPPTQLPSRHLRGLTVAACLAATACASGGAGTGGATPGAPSADAAGAEGAGSGYVAADVDFMRGMIHHHAQAIVMARMAPTHDAGPAVRRLAARILNSQKTEIALMADWLRDRGEPVPEYAALAEEGRDGAGADEGGEHDGHDPDGGHGADGASPGPLEGWDEGPQMPGILSDAQMAKLDAAHGEEFDRLFLTYMIDHHDGAVVMVDRLVRTPRAARGESVFRLASGIRADQSTEIDRMRSMLREQMFGPGNDR